MLEKEGTWGRRYALHLCSAMPDLATFFLEETIRLWGGREWHAAHARENSRKSTALVLLEGEGRHGKVRTTKIWMGCNGAQLMSGRGKMR
jgi:hypothetical protein